MSTQQPPDREGSERPTEPQAGRWDTYGPPAPSGQDHSAWAQQQAREEPPAWKQQLLESSKEHPYTPIYDQQGQYDRIVESLMPGEQVIAVYDAIGVSVLASLALLISEPSFKITHLLARRSR
jgi:hypothetical protein